MAAEQAVEQSPDQAAADDGTPDFVHLRVRSEYSLLSATGRVKKLVAAAKKDGQQALALTDDANLFGAVAMFKTCQKEGLRPLLGMSTNVALKSHTEASGADNPSQNLGLLAMDNTGWDNLRRLSSLAYIDGFHYRPRVDKELLAKHGEGLIALSGTVSGELAAALLQGDNAGALRVAGEYRELFGDRYYLEVMDTGYEPQRKVTEGTLQIADRLDIPVVATNDVHYLKQTDWVAHDVLLCIRNQTQVSNPDRFRMGSRQLFLKSRAEMAAAFRERPDALRNTVEVAQRCQVDIEFGNYHLPVYAPDTGEDPDVCFERLCREGLNERYGEVTPDLTKRLEYEMGIIRQLGFVSYFLITRDFIVKAIEMGIPVGPGRGSAAGSLVAYVLRITDLDPFKYNLIFERFLNPARVSMPDIDVDFCGERRDEVIDYCREKYGHEQVSQIITFGTMASRGVLRDVGRALQLPLGDVDKLCKKVPQGPGASLQAALESDPELKELRKESQENEKLFELGLQLEGQARHSSIHAAGVVIADRPVADYVPMARNGEDISTQWQMTELEEVGLLKVDFLGLKTLTILQEGARLVKETHGVDIDYAALPLDDPETYGLMGRGDTLGVFQLESSGMRELLAKLKPDTFGDVIAVLALYRPGPLGTGMVDTFCKRKHGEEKTTYYHESVKPILEETYGVMVYQEQVMRIANVVGGFSMSDADNLRKAMGKKKKEVMDEYEQKFVDGAVAQDYDGKFARELFQTMAHFAGYGFNKSHSAAYALLTYRTAWLKAHYPVEFFACNFTVESGNSDKVKEFVDECRRQDLRILPPDVNSSERYFSVEKAPHPETGVEEWCVRFGLGAIKGVGTKVADGIGESRREGGLYRTLDELCDRHESGVLNKTAMEALVRAGALDVLHPSRKQLMKDVDSALRASARNRADRDKGQGLLFGGAPATEEEAPASSNGQAVTDSDGRTDDWPEAQRLLEEKTALGFYLSGHPFAKRGAFLARLAGTTSGQLADLPAKAQVRIAGMISSVRVMQIKQGPNEGKKMARFLLEDLEGMIPVTCFARVYAEVKDLLVDDSIVVISGRVDAGSDEPALLLDTVEPAQRVVDREVGALVVQLGNPEQDPRLLDRIAAAVQKLPGEKGLMFEFDGEHSRFRVQAGSNFKVAVVDELVDRLADLMGPEKIAFTRR